jgi:radical SAM-linked protein
MWVRVKWTKVGKVRWTSHRDAARIWERALRRAELALVYSGGFSPRPRMSFGLALPTGCESLAEFLEVDLVDQGVDLELLPAVLTNCLPAGMSAVECSPVRVGAASLQQDVIACDWAIDVVGLGLTEVVAGVERLLASDEAVVTRRRKGGEGPDDIRPGIDHLTVVGPSADGQGVMLRAVLATKPRGVRPGDVVAAGLPGGSERRSLRITQLIERDGQRQALGVELPQPIGAGS